MTNTKINILFTRQLSQLDAALSVLSAEIFNIVACPTIDIFPIEKTQKRDQELSEIFTADYLVFTSKHAVIETMKYLSEKGTSFAELKTIITCAVGPMVAQQLAEYDVKVNMMPEVYSAEGVGKLFDPVVKDSAKVFFPRGNLAAKKLSAVLTEKGYSIVSPVIYNTELRCELDEPAQAIFDVNRVDCLVFTSPSSVKAMMSILTVNKQLSTLKQTLICAIGTTTKQACIEHGLKVKIIPKDFTVLAVAKAVASLYEQKNY